MKLQNPTKEIVKITIGGVNYELAPGGVRDIPEDAAVAWRDTHQFLLVGDNISEAPVEVEEPKAEEVEEEKPKVKKK